MNKHKMQIAISMAAILFTAVGAGGKTKAQKQAEVKKNAQQTLNKLYQARSSAKTALKAAAGYAAFSNFGMKIFLAGGGKGHGINFDNRTGQVTYMKMLEVQAGLGLGVWMYQLTDKPGFGAYREGDEVLQGRRPELKGRQLTSSTVGVHS